jgi:hypothetical protein
MNLTRVLLFIYLIGAGIGVLTSFITRGVEGNESSLPWFTLTGIMLILGYQFMIYEKIAYMSEVKE